MPPRCPITPGPAAVKLQEFIDKNAIGIRVASDAIGVTHPALLKWLSGAGRPEAAHRKAIEVWTAGEVPESLWMTDEERSKLEGVAEFRRPENGDAA